MFVVKKFYNESTVERLKQNIIANTYESKFLVYPKRIGMHSKINGNLICITNVSEEQERGGPVYMNFYGMICKKKYLIGIICPQMIYSLFTFGVCMITDEYAFIKIIALIIWLYIYLSNSNSMHYIYDNIVKWIDLSNNHITGRNKAEDDSIH